MYSLKFANVLLEAGERATAYPSLYYRGPAPLCPAADGAWRLCVAGTYDFTTYFNALSVRKLLECTNTVGVTLELSVRGAACALVQTKADVYAESPAVVPEVRDESPEGEGARTLTLRLRHDPDAVLVGFQLQAAGPLEILGGSYSLELSRPPRDVELALATTTFRKEDFILANIDLVRREILARDDEFSRHFHMLVVDNGRTLDAAALTGGRVTVFPNPNAGGSGGFARGMIEAMHLDAGVTHVLLMDDDVAVSPESIRRTYNLLRVLNDEYAEAFVSGAMLNYEVGDEQWEDVGYMHPNGAFFPVKPKYTVSRLHHVVSSEAYRPSEVQARNMYAAWWYCCIPVSTIRREGLPLPFFVRFDDAEYGMRCHPKFVSMNGLCIWHMSFHSRYNAAVERYQTTRNTLVGQSTTGVAEGVDFTVEFKRNVDMELKKFNYTNAELVLDALEDYLKGPSFIMRPVAEECFMAANRNAERLVPLDELLAGLDAPTRERIESMGVDELEDDGERSLKERLLTYFTGNFQKGPLAGKGSGTAVISAKGWEYQAGQIYGKDRIVAIDWNSRKGVVRTRDTARYKEVMARLKRDLQQLEREGARLRAEYAACREEMTSEAFWRTYLGI